MPKIRSELDGRNYTRSVKACITDARPYAM